MLCAFWSIVSFMNRKGKLRQRFHEIFYMSKTGSIPLVKGIAFIFWWETNIYLVINIFFRQITTFRKVPAAIVFGLQILQLMGLKPKIKGHKNFYECWDLTKKSISNIVNMYYIVWNETLTAFILSGEMKLLFFPNSMEKYIMVNFEEKKKNILK